MKRIMFILISLGLNCAWGATYYSTGDGAWNVAANWSTSATDPTLHPASIDPNSTFFINHNNTFDGWNPTSTSWAVINGNNAKFRTTAPFSNTNARIRLDKTGSATGAVDIVGDLSVPFIYSQSSSPISPVIKSTGNISVDYILDYFDGNVFNINCQNFTVNQKYNSYDASTSYKNLTTNITATGTVSITNMYSAGTLNVSAPGAATANVSVSNVYSDATKDFTFSTDGNLTVASTFEVKKSSSFTAGTVTLNSAGPSNTASTTNMTVNGNLTLPNGIGNNTKGSYTVNNGNLTIQSDINSGKLDNATINVNTGNFVMQNGASSYELAIDNNTSTINVTGGNMTVGNLKLSNNTAAVSISGNLTTLKAAGIEKNGSTASLTVGGNVTADFFSQNANTGTTTVGGNMTIAGSLNPLSGAITIGGNLTFGTNLMCNNSTTLTVGGNVSTSNTGAGALNLNSSDKLIIGGSFTTGTGNFTLVNNGLVQTGAAITINNMAGGTNNSSGTIISGGDLSFFDTDGSPATSADNPFFRNDGKLIIHGNIKADNVTIDSSNGSAMVTYYKNLSEPNSGQIIPKDGSHMPIELLSFTGTPAVSGIVLQWETASELQNKYFVIEKSSNGLQFETIAQTAGAGTSITKHSYSSIDNNPLQGTSYYRLKQVDEDGSETISKIISITIAGSTTAKMQLQPSIATAGDAIHCVFDANFTSTIDVIDILGVTRAKYYTNGEQTLTIQTELFESGLYFIRVTETGEVSNFVIK